MFYWFLATPYSLYPHGLDEAYKLAVATRGLLLLNDIPVFSPIVHSHPVAMMCGIDPLDHSIWLPAEAPIRRNAYGLIMLKAESWQISRGMEMERREFAERGAPIVYMEVGKVPEELLRLGEPIRD